MTEKIFFYSAISLVVGLALAYLKKGASQSGGQTVNGLVVLKMNKLYGIIGIISIIFGFGFSLLPVLSNEYNSVMFLIVLIMLLIFWGAGIPCWLYYKNHKLEFDGEKIIVKNVLGKEKTIQWSEINQITFSHFSSYLTIIDSKGEKIKIHQHIVGLSSFAKMIETKTSWKVKELKFPVNN